MLRHSHASITNDAGRMGEVSRNTIRVPAPDGSRHPCLPRVARECQKPGADGVRSRHSGSSRPAPCHDRGEGRYGPAASQVVVASRQLMSSRPPVTVFRASDAVGCAVFKIASLIASPVLPAWAA